MKKLSSIVAVALACVVGGVLVTQMTQAAVNKGKTRPMLTKHWMKGVMGPRCSALGKGLKAGPADDAAWAELTLAAALLNESSYVLMEDGRCPDGVWAKAATDALRKGSEQVMKATAAKDLEAANAAFKAMTASCGGCHKAHKKKKKAARL